MVSKFSWLPCVLKIIPCVIMGKYVARLCPLLGYVFVCTLSLSTYFSWVGKAIWTDLHAFLFVLSYRGYCYLTNAGKMSRRRHSTFEQHKCEMQSSGEMPRLTDTCVKTLFPSSFSSSLDPTCLFFLSLPVR